MMYGNMLSRVYCGESMGVPRERQRRMSNCFRSAPSCQFSSTSDGTSLNQIARSLLTCLRTPGLSSWLLHARYQVDDPSNSAPRCCGGYLAFPTLLKCSLTCSHGFGLTFWIVEDIARFSSSSKSFL